MTDVSLRIKVDSAETDKGKKSLDDLAKAGANAEGSSKGLTEQTNRLSTAAKAAQAAFTALIGSMALRKVIEYADEWQNAENRLKLVTSSSQELARVQADLLVVANTTRASFSSTAELYTTLTRSTTALGLSGEELLAITKTINQTFQVAGASAQGMEGAIRQLSQGLASGALRGDEFNSVAEQAPGIMDALAASLKMGRGELREFAATGGITSEILVNALQAYAETAEGMAATATRTFGQSMTEARNNMVAFIGSSDAVKASVQGAGGLIVTLSKNLDLLGDAAALAAIAYGSKLAGAATISTAAFIKSTAASAAARAAELARTQSLVASTAAEAARTAALVAGNSSMFTSSTALASAKAAQLAHTQAVAANTAATNAATAASGAWKASLMALFGPGAVIALGAAALYLLVQRQKEAAEQADILSTRFDKVRASLGALTETEIARAIQSEFEHMNALKAKQRTLQILFDTQGMYEDELRVLNLEVKEAESNHGLLVRQLQRVKDGWKPVTEETKAATAATIAHTKATLDLVHMMDSAAAASYNTAGAYVELMGVQVETFTRTTRLTQATKDATLGNVDAQDSIDELVEGMKGQGEASKELSQVMGLMRDDISSAFADMMMNGGNAFDNIAKSFERMVYKMVADWAAAGIMNMVGSAFGVSGAGGGSVLGGLVSGAKSAGGGSVMAGIGGAAKAAGGKILAGASTAASGLGAGAMALATNPITLAVLGAAAAAKLLDNGGTMSSNAGLLLKDVPGAKPDQKFSVPAFDSGFAPVGFARREDQGAAVAVIDHLRAYDSALTAMAESVGINVNMDWTKFAGLGTSETGRGTGVFVGLAAEDGKSKSASVQAQADQYVKLFVEGLGSQISPGAKSMILSAGNADAMLAKAAELVGGINGSHANGLAYVPFDGYRAELHKGERVMPANEARAMDAGWGKMSAELSGMRAALMDTAFATKRTADLLLRVTRDGESLVTVAA